VRRGGHFGAKMKEENAGRNASSQDVLRVCILSFFESCVRKGHFTLGVRTMKGPSNSMLNPLLYLRRYFIKVRLGPKWLVGFSNCMEYFDGLGSRKFGAKNGAT
jgi:hypothetical protein